MHEPLLLYSYWRSSAAWRVRIGLHLKGLEYETVPVHLLRDGGQQHSDEYKARNPQQLVPTLLHEERAITQSLAILEYLDETHPSPPLLPAVAHERARVRALAQLIACDIHPLNNLRVLQYLERECSVPQDARNVWVQHWIGEGFAALETLLNEPATGIFCHGDSPMLADCCLIPQVYNARRFGVDMAAFPAISRIEATCLALPAFADTRPEVQPDVS
jgi:maleylacetoacetate isomerase